MEFLIPKSIISDDYLFLWLKIMSYPSGKTSNVFDFCELRGLKFKNIDEKELFRIILFLKKRGDVNISKPEATKKKHASFWNLFNRDYSDREVLHFFKRSENLKYERILKEVNFQIIIAKSYQKILLNSLDLYLDDFENNRLTKVSRNYFTFEKQKECVVKIIEKESINCGNNLLMSTSDFNPKVKLLDVMLIFQRLGFLKIQNISLANKKLGIYKINFSLIRNKKSPFEKYKKQIPTLAKRKDGMYLIFYKNDKGVRISKTKNNASYRMLAMLICHFGTKRTVQSVFDEIKPKKYKEIIQERNSKTRNNQMIETLKNTRRELQRNNKLSERDLKIEINKKDLQIYITFIE